MYLCTANISDVNYVKTGLFQVGDVTVGGPIGTGLSGGEVIF